jgi:hypothetical protein
MQVLQHDLKHWLNDSKAMKVISEADVEWIRTDLIPRMFKLGVKRVAVVESHDEEHNEQLQRLTKHAAGTLPYPVKQFAEMDDAFEWMLAERTVAA